MKQTLICCCKNKVTITDSPHVVASANLDSVVFSDVKILKNSHERMASIDGLDPTNWLVLDYCLAY